MHKGSSSYKVTATVFSELCNDHQRLELTGGYAPRKLIGNQHQIIRSRNRPARFISFEDLTMKIMMLHLHSFLKVNYIWDLVQFAVTEIWGKVFQAAIWYGLVVHFRVYPIIYALPIILALDPRFFQSGLKPKLESWSSSQAKTPQSSNKVTDGYGLWTALKALFTIRRIIQLVLIFRFAQDLPFCFFVQTVAFVAFNKVITTHYFVWFFCLLPLILPWSSMKLKWEGLCCILVWMGAQSHWLLWGYLLEFRGKNVFIELWLTGLVFLAANTFILVMIIRRHKYSPAFDSMKIALKFE